MRFYIKENVNQAYKNIVKQLNGSVYKMTQTEL